MRGSGRGAQHEQVRFLVELSATDGRVSGTVSTADGPPIPFLGWLDLLRRLEDGLDPRPDEDVAR